MAFDTRRKEMLEQFDDNFSAVSSGQIIWDGVDNKAIDKDNPWIAVSIQPVTSNFASINSVRRVRHTGFFVVQVFIKPGQTTEAADDIAEAVAGALEGVRTATGISFGASNITRVGVVEGIYQLNVFTPYKYDDNRP